MNVIPTIDVNFEKVFARFSPAGIPESVRSNLRSVLPDLTKEIGGAVDEKLSSQLKSRTSLETKKELVENPTTIYGSVRVISSKNPLLPQWLETGTRPHDIAARNGKVLAFFWPRIGGMAFFPKVHHPGFKGIQYMATTFSEYEDKIAATITKAVQTGAMT